MQTVFFLAGSCSLIFCTCVGGCFDIDNRYCHIERLLLTLGSALKCCWFVPHLLPALAAAVPLQVKLEPDVGGMGVNLYETLGGLSYDAGGPERVAPLHVVALYAVSGYLTAPSL